MSVCLLLDKKKYPKMRLILLLLIYRMNGIPNEEISIRFAGKNEQAEELIRGFEFILYETWVSAGKISKDMNNKAFQTRLEEALRIEPIGMEGIVIFERTIEVPKYDMKELIQSAMIRSGIYEKQISLAFDVPLSQLIGSIWTYWTLLARISNDPKTFMSDISFDDILKRVYETFHSTWGRNIIPPRDRAQLALYSLEFDRDTFHAADKDETCIEAESILQGISIEQQEYIERLKQLPPYNPSAREAELNQKLKSAE